MSRPDPSVEDYWNDENPYAADPRLLEPVKPETLKFVFRPPWARQLALALGAACFSPFMVYGIVFVVFFLGGVPQADMLAGWVIFDYGLFFVVFSFLIVLFQKYTTKLRENEINRAVYRPVDLPSRQRLTWGTRFGVELVIGLRRELIPCRDENEQRKMLEELDAFRRKFW